MTFLSLMLPPLIQRLTSIPHFAQAFKNPIALRLQVSKSVAPGEEILVVAAVRNVSKAPVVLIHASLPMTELGMTCKTTFEGSSGPFEPDSIHPMMGQYFRSGGVSPGAFFALDPNESRELYREAFRRVFASGRPSGDLSQREKAARVDLSPGQYRLRIDYRLDPHIPVCQEDRVSGDRGYPHPAPETAGPEARRLLEACWRGETSASDSFTVTPVI